jgi:hypothetical protein
METCTYLLDTSMFAESGMKNALSLMKIWQWKDVTGGGHFIRKLRRGEEGRIISILGSINLIRMSR